VEQSIYEAAGGADAFVALATAWHARCLDDPVVSHAFLHPGGHPDHIARLAAYWAEALGGPPDYSGSMADETYVLRLHSGNGEHNDMDDRAIACFVAAQDDAGLPNDERLRAALTDYFRWAIGEMNTHPDSAAGVPAQLPMPHWSWGGLVQAA
jgi:hemoglobin